tara:strand:- start:54 stop:605 length:552 start_codon:yes stop_codon:yes gene_type:complete
MIISEHASQRIRERFCNLVDIDFLESRVSDANRDMFDLLVDTCSPDNKKQLLKGYREIKFFDNLGVYGVVNKSTLELITVFPKPGKSVTRVRSGDKYELSVLTLKAKQMQEMSKAKRKNRGIGAEMNRVCRKLALLKQSTGKDAKTKANKYRAKIERQLSALKKLAIENIGEDAVYNLLDSIE